MINKNILKIRKKLDNLDNQFLRLIKKRTYYVDQVLKNKINEFNWANLLKLVSYQNYLIWLIR